MSSESGKLVFDIKRFALHDGPGIRSTAFIKGCPLNCLWCQNPEGIEFEKILWYSDSRCISCGRCIEVCPHDALSGDHDADRFIRIDLERCTRCGDCVEACPSGALHWDSRRHTPEELAEQLMRDSVFYDSSGGGITLSGGEPMANPDFSVEVLRICGEKGYHRAVETTLFANRGTIERFLPHTDLFLADLKLIDNDEHLANTGVENTQILDNFRFLAKTGKDIIVRVPLIPGITDTKKNIAGISRFVASLDRDIPIELLNFNPLAESKYRALGRDYKFSDTLNQLPAERVSELKEIILENHPHVL